MIDKNKPKKKPQNIEELAFAIKFLAEEYTKVELMRFRSDLVSELLKKIKLSDFTKDYQGKTYIGKDNDKPSEHNNSKLLEESFQYNEYDSVAITKAYISSMESYGMRDEETGEIVPFLQIFRAHYKYKKLDIAKNKLKENRYSVEIKEKEKQIKDYLVALNKKWGKKELPEICWNYDKAVLFIRNLSMDKDNRDKALQTLTDLYTTSYVKRESGIPMEDVEGNQVESSSLEQVAITSEKEKVNQVDRLTNLIENLYVEVDDDLKLYAKYYITMKILLKYTILGHRNTEIEFYIDKDLQEFYYRNYSDYTDEKYIKDIIADYIGKKSDTVRKKLNKVGNIIQNSLLKSVSKKI